MYDEEKLTEQERALIKQLKREYPLFIDLRFANFGAEALNDDRVLRLFYKGERWGYEDDDMSWTKDVWLYPDYKSSTCKVLYDVWDEGKQTYKSELMVIDCTAKSHEETSD